MRKVHPVVIIPTHLFKICKFLRIQSQLILLSADSVVKDLRPQINLQHLVFVQQLFTNSVFQMKCNLHCVEKSLQVRLEESIHAKSVNGQLDSKQKIFLVVAVVLKCIQFYSINLHYAHGLSLELFCLLFQQLFLLRYLSSLNFLEKNIAITQ